MQRQLELMLEVVECERTIQKQLAGRLLAPVDAIFDLLEESGLMLRRQAEALEAAGRALEETAGLVKSRAELFERTIGALREPAERARAAAGLDRRVRKSGGRESRRGRSAEVLIGQRSPPARSSVLCVSPVLRLIPRRGPDQARNASRRSTGSSIWIVIFAGSAM
jgi:hypothetical protein